MSESGADIRPQMIHTFVRPSEPQISEITSCLQQRTADLDFLKAESVHSCMDLPRPPVTSAEMLSNVLNRIIMSCPRV